MLNIQKILAQQVADERQRRANLAHAPRQVEDSTSSLLPPPPPSYDPSSSSYTYSSSTPPSSPPLSSSSSYPSVHTSNDLSSPASPKSTPLPPSPTPSPPLSPLLPSSLPFPPPPVPMMIMRYSPSVSLNGKGGGGIEIGTGGERGERGGGIEIGGERVVAKGGERSAGRREGKTNRKGVGQSFLGSSSTYLSSSSAFVAGEGRKKEEREHHHTAVIIGKKDAEGASASKGSADDKANPQSPPSPKFTPASHKHSVSSSFLQTFNTEMKAKVIMRREHSVPKDMNLPSTQERSAPLQSKSVVVSKEERGGPAMVVKKEKKTNNTSRDEPSPLSSPPIIYENYEASQRASSTTTTPSSSTPNKKHLNMFSSTLEEIMHHQRDEHPHLQVPLIVVELTEAIIACNGGRTEGIFRVPGAAAEISRLKAYITTPITSPPASPNAVSPPTSPKLSSWWHIKGEHASSKGAGSEQSEGMPQHIGRQRAGSIFSGLRGRSSSMSIASNNIPNVLSNNPISPRGDIISACSPIAENVDTSTTSNTSGIQIGSSGRSPIQTDDNNARARTRGLRVEVTTTTDTNKTNTSACVQILPSSPKVDDPNVLAGVLKLWLREIPEPIIPKTMYYDCMNASENPSDSIQMLDKLPEINRATVNYIVDFLLKIAHPDNEQYTKMGVDNIAMVFAPGFLRCPSTDPFEIMINTVKEKNFMYNIMTRRTI